MEEDAMDVEVDHQSWRGLRATGDVRTDHGPWKDAVSRQGSRGGSSVIERFEKPPGMWRWTINHRDARGTSDHAPDRSRRCRGSRTRPCSTGARSPAATTRPAPPNAAAR